MKSTEVSMQDAALLRHQINQLNTANKYQKGKKKNARAFIQDGGSLTGDEGLKRLEEVETRQEPSSRPRRPAKCSNCNQEGHNRLKCPTR